MATIQEFKSNLLGGGARPNQFRVNLTFPTIVTGVNEAAKKAQFLCESASLPGSFVDVAQTFYRGRAVKLAGERTFQDWSIQVINDTDFAIRNAFEKWSNLINDNRTNQGTTNPLLYVAQLSVDQLDRSGSTIKTYTFIDAWPTAIGEIGLNYSNNNQLETFPVTFAYSHWESDTTATSGVGISLNI